MLTNIFSSNKVHIPNAKAVNCQMVININIYFGKYENNIFVDFAIQNRSFIACNLCEIYLKIIYGSLKVSIHCMELDY